MSVIQSMDEWRVLHGPCSPCGDGDTALRYHSHSKVAATFTLTQLQQWSEEYLTESGVTQENSLPCPRFSAG